jgi:hypothetical protein
MTKVSCVKAVLQMAHLVIIEGPLLPGTRRSTVKLERQRPLTNLLWPLPCKICGVWRSLSPKDRQLMG